MKTNIKRQRYAKAIFCLLLAAFMLIGTACTPNTDIPPSESDSDTQSHADSKDESSTPDSPDSIQPVIWSFFGNAELSAAGVTLSDTSDQGAYEFTSLLQDDVVSLKYKTHSSYSAYRLLLQRNDSAKLTDKHIYVRVKFMTTQTVKGAVNIRNTDTGERVTLVPNAAMSKGALVVSEPIVLKEEYIQKWLNGHTWSLEYSSMSSSSDFYLKEISFFGSKEDAYAHYGDSASDFVEYRSLTFGSSGNTRLLNEGTYIVDQLEQCVCIGMTNTELISDLGKYAFGLCATESGNIPNTYRYIRVLYQAQNPTDDKVSLTVRTGATTSTEAVTWEGIGNTEDWTLSAPRLMNQGLFERISSGSSVYISFKSNESGGAYKVKAIYLFGSKDDAETFEAPKASFSVSVEGLSIGGYSIVIPEDAVKRERDMAMALQGNIFGICGHTVPIVTDTEAPEQALEILIGKTDRRESQEAYKKYSLSGADIGEYSLTTVNKKLIFAAFFNPGLEELMNSFKSKYLSPEAGENVEIIGASISGTLSGQKFLTPYTKWQDVTNVSDPVIFNDRFDGTVWWSEENNTSAWTMSNGVLSSEGRGFELAFLQAYEKNATFSADMTPRVSPDNSTGSFGLQLRYTSTYGYVRGGYDYRRGEWFIDYREGEDFTTVRAAAKNAALTSGTSYSLCLTVENRKAVLTVDGQKLLEANVTQVSPGRIAVFNYGIPCTVDNASVTFSGGMGQLVIPDVSHMILPIEAYLEGGSVIALSDGKLHYIHSSGVAFSSSDEGRTFEEEDSWYSSGYPSVIRLANGKLLRTASEHYQGVDSVVVKESSDEGRTWTTIGVVCQRLYSGSDKWWAINMNDKLTQLSTGRLILVQSFENMGNTTGLFDGRNTFFEIFYSDNNGATWTKSRTTSRDLTDLAWFSEGKVVECEGGVLRLMSSWNNYSTMVYSESTDGGETWGELQTLTGFDCSCSSYAIMRDPNGPTDHTYYMVWCYTDIGTVSGSNAITMPRSRLCLAYTTDGKNWVFLGDIWCWESNYTYYYGMLNHIVDPFIYITDDTVIIGSGISEKWKVIGEGSSNVHQAQRQHIWSIPKSSLTISYSKWPKV